MNTCSDCNVLETGWLRMLLLSEVNYFWNDVFAIIFSLLWKSKYFINLKKISDKIRRKWSFGQEKLLAFKVSVKSNQQVCF